MSELSVEKRYDLVCRAVSKKNGEGRMSEILDVMEKTIREELLKVTRHHSPPDFVNLFMDFQQEFERFREFSEFPDLAQKVTVGFGGGFSAGKSSLLNAIIGQRLLPAEVDPTTTVPAYVIHGETENIGAINIFGRKIPLSADEFVVLTHDFERTYGTPLGHLLKSAHLALPSLPWKNLALLDTPGYSNTDNESSLETTDAGTARAQLNTAQFIVWIVRVESGTVPELDIRFLSSLRPDIPKLVILSQVDKRPPEEIPGIIDCMKKVLSERGVNVLDVAPFSARKKNLYPVKAVTDYLDDWNMKPRQVLFARNFKVLFSRFIHYLDACRREAERNLNRLNRVLAVADDEIVRSDIQGLQVHTRNQITRLEEERLILENLCVRFFSELKKVGDAVGIEMPEPSEIDLLDDNRVVLADLLREYRRKAGIQEKEYSGSLAVLMNKVKCARLPMILNRMENIEADPLPRHYAAETDSHTKDCYATLLAAVAMADGEVSKNESMIFSGILKSLGLGHRTSGFFDNTQYLNQSGLEDFFRAVKESDLSMPFILEAMLISRADGPLSGSAAGIIGGMAEIMGMNSDDLAALPSLACHILGVKNSTSIPFNWNHRFYETWHPFLYRKLTMQELRKSIDESYGIPDFNHEITAGLTATIVDEKTGLQWMRCAVGQVWDGKTCKGEAGRFNWNDFKKLPEKFNREKYAGFDDWRLPSKYELESLIMKDVNSGPQINLKAFPGTPIGQFWSSSPVAYDGSGAWVVYFPYGVGYWSSKGFSYYVRLVRGGQ